MGYAKAHSYVSLIMGGSFSLVLAFFSLGIYKECKVAYTCAMGITLFLLAFFVYRFFLTEKFFPAGMMSLISLGVLCLGWFGRKKSSP